MLDLQQVRLQKNKVLSISRYSYSFFGAVPAVAVVDYVTSRLTCPRVDRV